MEIEFDDENGSDQIDLSKTLLEIEREVLWSRFVEARAAAKIANDNRRIADPANESSHC